MGTIRKFTISITLWLVWLGASGQSGLCDSITPFFEVDLTGQPNGTWVSSPPIERQGNCCGSSFPDVCIEFELILDPATIAISFDIVSGAVPGGALFYQINCDPPVAVGDPICISGPGPHIITFCKPGNNLNTYAITAISAPMVSPDQITTTDCNVTIGSAGIELTSITWSDITGGGVYESYLSCTEDCDTTIVTPIAGHPPYVDYQICGVPLAGPCYPDPLFCDTVRVYFNPPVYDSIYPNPAVYCELDSGIMLEGFVLAGVAPYDYLWYDGPGGTGTLLDSSSTYFAGVPGTYSLEIRDSLYPHCPSSFVDVVVSVDYTPTVDAGPPVTVCPTNPDVSLNGTIADATGGTWSGGTGTFTPNDSTLNATYTPSAAEISVGQVVLYLATYPNGACPGVVDSVMITITDSLIVSLTASSLLCFGDTTSILSTVSGGTAPYSYLWGGGETTPNITGQPAGTYTLTVTDATANACTASASVTIPENPPFTVVAPDTNIVSCDATATISISASGGSGSYTYLWNTGDTTPSITVISGEYIVIVTDSVGCTASDTITVSSASSALAATIPATVPLCYADTAMLVPVVTGGFGSYEYLWDTGDTTQSISVGTGAYCVTVTDSVDCVASACILVTEAPPLLIDFTAPEIVCFGDPATITATVSGGTPGYSYSWSTGATTPGITEPEGTYVLEVTDSNPNNCMITDTITVLEAPPLSMTMTATDVLCFGATNGTATGNVIGGIPPYTYTWAGGVGTDSVADPLTAGTYYLTVSDSLGCMVNDSVIVNEPTPLILSLDSAVHPTCAGMQNGVIAVSPAGGTPGYNFFWSPVGGTDSVAMNIPAGVYVGAVVDQNGCIDTLQVEVVDPLPLQAIITDSIMVSCAGGSDGSATVTGIGGTPPYTYQWVVLGDTSATVMGLGVGTYSVTVFDQNNCSATVTVIITESPPLGVTMTVTDVTCYGYNDGQIIATVTGGNVPTLYTWTPNVSTGDTASSLSPGTYDLTVTDLNGCTISGSAVVNEPLELILSMGSDPSYCGLPLGQAWADVTNGVSPFSYQWDTAAGSQTTDTATALLGGTYYITVTDLAGCFQADSIEVIEIPAGVAAISSYTNVQCFGANDGTATVSISGTATPPVTYEWFNIGGLPIGQTTATATGLGSGVYYAVVTDDNGCISFSDTVTIIEPLPLSVSGSGIAPLCYGNCTGMATVTVSGGTTPYSYLWDDTLAQTMATAINLCSGLYSAQIMDDNGCTVMGFVNLANPTPIVLDSSVTNSTCGLSNGSACVLATGGTGPYTYLWPTGSTSNCVSGVFANTYIVTVTDNQGCTKEISVTVQDLGVPTAVIDTLFNVSCYGECNGWGTVEMQDNFGSYTVQWDANAGSQTTPTATNLCAGTYVVTATDSAGCISPTTLTITEPDTLMHVLTGTNPICVGSCDGTASINIAGGAPPYTVQWMDNIGTPMGTTTSLSGLCSGIYHVVIEDANGCQIIDQIELTDPLPLVATSSSTDALCGGSCTGTVTALPGSGVPPYMYQWDAATGGQTTQTATGLCAGTYTCTITDDNDCQTTILVTVSQPLSMSTTISNSGDVSCFGACDGFIEMTVVGGTPPYSFSWTNGDTTPIISGLCGGTYCVTVTDANGCQGVECITITEPDPISVSAFVLDASCAGMCNGQIGLTIVGGTPVYDITWNSPGFPTTPIVTNLCTGSHEVFIVDANNCAYDTAIFISEPTPLQVTLALTNANCGQNNGQICATPSGGVGSYTIEWNDPYLQTTFCADSLVASCYVAVITDANNCFLDTIVCVDDLSGPSTSALGSSDVTCTGAFNGMVEFSSSGGAAPLSSVIVNSVGDTITIGWLATGLPGNCYSAIVTDAAGCVASATTCIDEPIQVTVGIISSQDATCYLASNGTATASAFGGTAPLNYTWSGGTTPNTPSTGGLGYGTYTVTVTDANGCSNSDTVFIDQPPELIVAVDTVFNPHCFGDCTGFGVLSATGGTGVFNYLWSPMVSVSTGAYSLCAGTYGVVVTDLNGCLDSTNFAINEPTQLNLTISSTNATCGNCNGSASVTAAGATSPYTYNWPAGGYTTPTVAGVLCMGYQYVQVTDTYGCSDTVGVNVVNEPSPVIDSLTFGSPSCNGVSNGSATVFATGGSGLLGYSWSASAGGQVTPTAIGIPAGLHCVTVTDINGCSDFDCINVTEPDPLTGIGDGPDTVCVGSTAQIWANAYGGVLPYSITWNDPGLLGMGPLNVVPFTDTSFCFSVTDANGCISPTACIDINVYPNISLTMPGTATICIGDSTSLSATAVGGTGGPYVFTWYEAAPPPLGSLILSETASATSGITVNPSADTWYYLEVDDGCSSAILDSVRIIVAPLPSLAIIASDSSGCVAFTPEFILATDVGTWFEYDFSCDGVVDISSAATTVNWTFNTPGVYDVCVEATSAVGCSASISAPGIVTVYSPPSAQFLPDPYLTSMLYPGITMIDQSVDGITYNWNFGDGTIVSGAYDSILVGGSTYGPMTQPTHIYQDTGVYVVILTIENEYGCVDSYIQEVYIESGYILFAPSAFTPNGDGKNDYFFPQGIGIDEQHFTMYIFNRWGELIYETYRLDQPWDGTYNGLSVQIDVYVWRILTWDYNENAHEYFGHVTVVR